MKSASPAALAAKEKPFDNLTIYVLKDPSSCDRLPGVIAEIATLFDGSRTAAQVLEQTQISETKCTAIIKKLTATGILQRQTSRGFSEEEERFFAEDVRPIDECDEPFESVGEKFRAAVCEMMVRLRPKGQRSLL